jgi:hypothetical protein
MAEEPYRNPASAYADPVRSHREIEVLFRGRPTLVAPSPDLPATGEFLTTEVADIPLLLLRGEDGVVRCCLNARRHRGGRVAVAERFGIRSGRCAPNPRSSTGFSLTLSLTCRRPDTSSCDGSTRRTMTRGVAE